MTAALSSFRPDVFALDPPRLLASLCGECAAKIFPPREVCPRCGGAVAAARVPLSTAGVVYAFTAVRTAPPGLTVPYVLAHVDLPADDVRVLSRLVGRDPEEIAVGDHVRLAAAPAEPMGDEPAAMFVFAYDDWNGGS